MGNKPSLPIGTDGVGSIDDDQAEELRTSIHGKPPAQANQQLTMSDFVFLRELGHGTFGKVWMVKYKGDNMIYAMKVMSKRNVVNENMVKHVRLEKEILATIGNKHPFVVGLKFSFQTPRTLCFVIEYLSGGSLFHHLRESEAPFTREVAIFYAAEIVLALEALHAEDFLYRDLKLENCLLDAQGHIRLTDFGLSRRLTPRLRRVRSYSGSNIYVAPEVLSDNSQVGHGKAVDWWGFGVLLHLLVTQQAPFWSEDNDELFRLIKEGDPPDFSQYSFLDADTVSLLQMLLVREPNSRLGFSDQDLAASGAQQIKNHPFFSGVDWAAVAAKNLRPPIEPPIDYAISHAQTGSPDDSEVIDAEVFGTPSPDAPTDEDIPEFYFQLSMLDSPADNSSLDLMLLCRICGIHVSESQVKVHSRNCLANTNGAVAATSSASASTSYHTEPAAHQQVHVDEDSSSSSAEDDHPAASAAEPEPEPEPVEILPHHQEEDDAEAEYVAEAAEVDALPPADHEGQEDGHLVNEHLEDVDGYNKSNSPGDEQQAEDPAEHEFYDSKTTSTPS